jgi:hypothetical protein
MYWRKGRHAAPWQPQSSGYRSWGASANAHAGMKQRLASLFLASFAALCGQQALAQAPALEELLSRFRAQAQEAPISMESGQSFSALNIEFHGCGAPASALAFGHQIQRALRDALPNQLECLAQVSPQARWDVRDLLSLMLGQSSSASGAWRRIGGRLPRLQIHCLGEAETLPGNHRHWNPGELAMADLNQRDRLPRIAVAQERILGESPARLADLFLHELLHLRGYAHDGIQRDMPYISGWACSAPHERLTESKGRRLRELALSLARSPDAASTSYWRDYGEALALSGIPSDVGVKGVFTAILQLPNARERKKRVAALLQGLMAGEILDTWRPHLALAFVYSGTPFPSSHLGSWAEAQPVLLRISRALDLALQGDRDASSLLELGDDQRLVESGQQGALRDIFNSICGSITHVAPRYRQGGELNASFSDRLTATMALRTALGLQ